MDAYVISKTENSPESTDDEEVYTCRPPETPTPERSNPANSPTPGCSTDTANGDTSTPQQPENTQEDEISPPVSPVRKRIRCRGGIGRARGLRTRGGRGNARGGYRGRENRVQAQFRNLENDIQNDNDDENRSSDSSDENNLNDDNNDDADLFVWNDTSRPLRQFQFIGTPGVKVQPDDITSHLECLKLFLSDNVISNIVRYTNSYAETMQNLPEIRRRMDESARSLFNLWKPIDNDELWVYISILLLQGIIQKPTNHMYWSKDPFLSTPIFSRLMRRDRFEQIRKMIHFTDPLQENPEDALRKLSSFLDSLSESFARVYTPKQNVAVDEYLSLWKGRLRFRVYIPNKRERYGVKIYMLCESDSGYLMSFIIYCGADTKYNPPADINLPKNFDEYKSPSKVVLSLASSILNQGYCVIVDNLYTSPELARALFENGTDIYGTLRKKGGLPKDFWKWKPQKGIGVAPMIKYCDEKFIVFRWNDPYKKKSTKVVSMLSSIHIGELIDTGKVDFATRESIIKPDAIVDYNANMGGVDLLSRVIVPYSIQQKGGNKWYRKIGELFIELSLYNAYIVWKNLNNSTATQLDFRRELINEIITIHLSGQPLDFGRGVADNTNPLRLKGRHFIRKKARGKRGRCVRCNKMGVRHEVMYECRTCDVSLCIEPCFQIYHTKKDITQVSNLKIQLSELCQIGNKYMI